MATSTPPTLTSYPCGPLKCQSIRLQPSQTDTHRKVRTSVLLHSRTSRTKVSLSRYTPGPLLTHFIALDLDVTSSHQHSNRRDTCISIRKVAKSHPAPCQRAVKLPIDGFHYKWALVPFIFTRWWDLYSGCACDWGPTVTATGDWAKPSSQKMNNANKAWVLLGALAQALPSLFPGC